MLGKNSNPDHKRTKMDWFGREMPSRLKENLSQAVEHEPLDHGLLQQ